MPLHLKYRPKTLDEIVGNEATIRALKSVLSRNEETPHSFLLTGPSGCGKTTLARIVASELGCSQADFMELDSADFRGIETVREIRRRMPYAASEGKIRVWLLDECHKLTADAQEALLKALEDTPSHVYMILATTNPEKLRITLKRRCTPFEVGPLDPRTVSLHLRTVARQEKKKIPKPVRRQIAKDTLGSLGMALMILDKIIDLEPEDMTKEAEDMAERQSQTIELCRALIKKGSWMTVARILKNLDEEPETVRRAVLNYFNSAQLSNGPQSKFHQVMVAFSDPFYDTGKAGLTMACFEAISA